MKATDKYYMKYYGLQVIPSEEVAKIFDASKEIRK